MKRDIESRIVEKDHNSSAKTVSIKSNIQEKLNKFIIEIDVVEKEFLEQPSTEYESQQFNQEIEKLKNDTEKIQSKLELQKTSTGEIKNDDLILNNLSFLKEIANQMRVELEAHNKALENSLQGINKNKESLEKSQNRLSKIEKCVEKLPNSCLLTFIITLALSILLTTALL